MISFFKKLLRNFYNKIKLFFGQKYNEIKQNTLNNSTTMLSYSENNKNNVYNNNLLITGMCNIYLENIILCVCMLSM